jgi:hypothetical protein
MLLENNLKRENAAKMQHMIYNHDNVANNHNKKLYLTHMMIKCLLFVIFNTTHYDTKRSIYFCRGGSLGA